MNALPVRVLVFAKAPTPGAVKTRLFPVLSAHESAALHAGMVVHTLQRLALSTEWETALYCSPDPKMDFFCELGQRFSCACLPQKGQDLGQRMANAIHATLAEGYWPIVVGTDCPDINEGIIRSAIKALCEGSDAVLVPAEDGGYVLLGVRQAQDTLFEGVEWGTERVLQQTRDRLQQQAWRWCELKTLWDLDRPADLIRYQNRFMPEV